VGDKTAIAWTDHTWNPWMGCHKVSAGCKHCYAEELTKRRMGIDVWGLHGNRQRTGVQVWNRPFRWNREAEALGELRLVFCASLADVFEDEEGPNEWRAEVFEVIEQTPWLHYQLLTKRPENLERMLPSNWGDGWPNVWLGTSIENNEVAHRATTLTSVPSVVHFVSYEPAIGPLDALDLTDIEWLICGGESGPDYRPMKLEWAQDMRRRCEEAGVPFFFKQNSARRTEMGIDALGEIIREYPIVRQEAR
jgi:protein gp37